MPMGWWKPYFFLDPNGVQVLAPALVIDGSIWSIILSGAGIAALAVVDRYAAHASRVHTLSCDDDTASGVYISTLFYTIQRFTSGLLMLIMMTFNIVLFLEVVLFSGAAEFWMKKRWHRSRSRLDATEGNFTRVPPLEIEMDDGC